MDITRRFFLGGATAGLLLSTFGATALPAPRGLHRPTTKRRRAVVAIFLRGGIDGLNLVAPYADERYRELRRNLAVAPPGGERGAVDLDGYFGLNPAARALGPLFESGTAVALQAVGWDGNTRSHFEEQDTWETCTAGGDPGATGWLNRHLASSEGHGPIRAVTIGSTLPRILRGEARALALRGLDDLGRARSSAALAKAYADAATGAAAERLRKEAETAFDALRTLEAVAAEPYEPSAEYPDTDIARRLREVARLVKADLGLEVAQLDYGGWDSHENQGGFGGSYHQRLQRLCDALAAFATDLDDRLDDVLVLTLSEFGRTASVNGTGGTDHGSGNALIALGGPVHRRREERDGAVLGTWPGLERDQLEDGRDLAFTTDFRHVLAEVVAGHLGNTDLETVLPGVERRPVGLV